MKTLKNKTELELSTINVSNPATYTMIYSLRCFQNFKCEYSDKDLAKRLDYQKAYSLLDDLRKGYIVTIL